MKNAKALKRPIYLDNAASTPMDPRVIQAMMDCLSIDGTFGNSASKDHIFGWQAAEVIEAARDEIAQSIGCSPLNLIFTSGATESNNLAIHGLASGVKKQYNTLLEQCHNDLNQLSHLKLESDFVPFTNLGELKNHIVTSSVEHKAVLECCALLEEEGFEVTYITPRHDGSIDEELLINALTPKTFLVSIAQANSVLGTINDIHSLAKITKERGIFFHSDCAQSNGILDLALDKSDVSMVTLTPEKIYGPKGVGALYIKNFKQTPLHPLIVGGGHEKGLRGGTLATHQIVAMGKAFDLIKKERAQVQEYVGNLRTRLIAGLKTIENAQINGSETNHVPGIVSVTFHNIDGKLLIPTLRQVACSTGSACSSKELTPSYILSAIGLSDDEARSSLRLSIGKFNTEQEIDEAIAHIKQTVQMLQTMANT